jgi:colanic acid/amylovoran biosynthesis protein
MVNSPKLIRSAYGFMDIFLGTRMHSNIFAISQGVPTLAIAYLYKTTGIMQDLGLNEWTVDIKGLDAESLTYMLIRLWNSRYKVKQKIEENLPLLIEKTAKTGLLIHKDFLSIYS